MSKDKVESRTEHCTLHQHYREECINCRVHRKAALPSVPEQGQAESDELAMGRAGTFLKSHGIHGDTSFVGVCGLLVLYERALAASRSEAQPPQEWEHDEDCMDGNCPHPDAIEEASRTEQALLDELDGADEWTAVKLLREYKAGAPAAGSAERETIEKCAKVAETYAEKGGDSSVRYLREHGAAWIAGKIRALAGTDTDVAKGEVR